jgi:hypothetical protein
MESRDNSVYIAMGNQLEGRGSIPGRRSIFLFDIESRAALELIQPPIQWVSKAHFPGVKRPIREAENSPPSTAEVNNALMARCLIN